MEFKNEKLGVSFRLPEKITVRMQLAYFSNAGLARDNELFERYWLGAVALIEDWRCDLLPNIRVSLDEVTDPKIVDVILWAGMEVKRHMDGLDGLPKNS